jgi:hypothetical protein
LLAWSGRDGYIVVTDIGPVMLLLAFVVGVGLIERDQLVTFIGSADSDLPPCGVVSASDMPVEDLARVLQGVVQVIYEVK